MSITQVLAQPVESSELGISATVERAGSDQFRFHMRIDAAGLKFEQKDGRANAALEVQWVQLDAGGHDVGSHGQMLTFRLSPETFASTERDGLKISFAETIDARATELRFAARDPVTGISGSVYIPVRSLK